MVLLAAPCLLQNSSGKECFCCLCIADVSEAVDDFCSRGGQQEIVAVI